MTWLEALAIWAPTAVAAAVAMEFWAALLHRRAWHGPLWPVHKSHHQPRAGAFEANDWLSSLHAPIAIALILYGCLGEPGPLREIGYGWGLGMTAFGLLYLTFHDGLMHGRLPVGFLRRVRYFQMLCDAHAIHHQKNGGPYGFFYVPQKLRGRLARASEPGERSGGEGIVASGGDEQRGVG